MEQDNANNFPIAVGASYRCTDDDFDGTVTVTIVNSARVYYQGDADGDATVDEFRKAYRPV